MLVDNSRMERHRNSLLGSPNRRRGLSSSSPAESRKGSDGAPASKADGSTSTINKRKCLLTTPDSQSADAFPPKTTKNLSCTCHCSNASKRQCQYPCSSRRKKDLSSVERSSRDSLLGDGRLNQKHRCDPNVSEGRNGKSKPPALLDVTLPIGPGSMIVGIARPSLLDCRRPSSSTVLPGKLCASQQPMPPFSAPPAASSASPTPLFAMMTTTNRRVLLPSGGCEEPNEHFAGGQNAQPKVKMIDRGTLTEGHRRSNKCTSTDPAIELDLPWLYKQRSMLEQRIAQLEEALSDAKLPQGSEAVSYFNGYYCRACKKCFTGGYSTKVKHCSDPTHLENVDELSTDPELMFKCLDEQYDEIIFDDTVADDNAGGDSKFSADSCIDKIFQSIKASDRSGNRFQHSQKQRCSTAARSDDDDDDEESERKTRFDRTRISR